MQALARGLVESVIALTVRLTGPLDPLESEDVSS